MMKIRLVAGYAILSLGTLAASPGLLAASPGLACMLLGLAILPGGCAVEVRRMFGMAPTGDGEGDAT